MDKFTLIIINMVQTTPPIEATITSTKVGGKNAIADFGNIKKNKRNKKRKSMPWHILQDLSNILVKPNYTN